MLRKSVPASLGFSFIVPVSKPLPSGLSGTKPMPNSSQTCTRRSSPARASKHADEGDIDTDLNEVRVGTPWPAFSFA